MRWRDRRSGSFSDSVLRTVQRFSAPLRRKLWSGSSNESGTITRRAKGVSMETTMAELAPYHAGLAKLFRLLRNAVGADISDPMGPIAITSGYVAAMENTVAVAGPLC